MRGIVGVRFPLQSRQRGTILDATRFGFPSRPSPEEKPMSVLRLSRVAFGPVLIVLAVILVRLFVSVRLAGALGAVPGPPDKKGEEPKNKLDNPLDVKGKLEDNDPNDPARNQ